MSEQPQASTVLCPSRKGLECGGLCFLRGHRGWLGTYWREKELCSRQYLPAAMSVRKPICQLLEVTHGSRAYSPLGFQEVPGGSLNGLSVMLSFVQKQCLPTLLPVSLPAGGCW